MKECPNCVVSVHDEYNVCRNCSYNFTTQKVEGFVSDDMDIKNDGNPPKKIECLRCKKEMLFGANLKFQSFDVYVCPNCEKVEFFLPRVS